MKNPMRAFLDTVPLVVTLAVTMIFLISLPGCGKEGDNSASQVLGPESPVVSASPSGSDGDDLLKYQITIENITGGQPFSPPVVATHRKSIRMFRVGKQASIGLEAIAEDGNEAPMFSRFDSSPRVTQAIDVGMPLTPSGTVFGDFTDAVTFDIYAKKGDRLSMAMMLICTNDGFTGLDAVKLPKHDYEVYWLGAYDSGTEYNTEQSEDIVDPCSGLGPFALAGDPDGNVDDAVDSDPHLKIASHAGIQGNGELSVTEHSWDGPVAKVTVRLISGGDDDDDDDDNDDHDDDDDDDDDD